MLVHRDLFVHELLHIVSIFLGYIFAGDVIATMEKQSKELANSVMKRAEAVYNKSNTKVCIVTIYIILLFFF